jgi:hypothetical protein
MKRVGYVRDDVGYIPLTRGKVALVDPADVQLLGQWTWTYLAEGYAYRTEQRNNRKSAVYMHRQLLAAPGGCEVDHINGNRLDNRRANLRLVSRAQNRRNQRPGRRNQSGFLGVSRYPKNPSKWVAHIRGAGKSQYLGMYETPEAAARAYDTAATARYGVHAHRNFPAAA